MYHCFCFKIYLGKEVCMKEKLEEIRKLGLEKIENAKSVDELQ